MGATSKSALEAGGYVVGVIPEAMAKLGGEKAPAAPTQSAIEAQGGTPMGKLRDFDLQTHERYAGLCEVGSRILN